MDSHKQVVTQKLVGTGVGCRNLEITAEETLLDNSDQDEDETDEDEEEPTLKYVRMTTHLNPIYRNGDATSNFIVVGDKMFIGTHNGNVHVVLLPSYQFLRVYHAHSASISSIAISPFLPPAPNVVSLGISRIASQTFNKSPSISSNTSTTSPRSNRTSPAVPNIPSNAIYIATSSIDGNVCIQSLVDTKDVQLRNFGRPVQAVALSPEYKSDKTYLSGGLAGNLVLTVGGKIGTNTTSATAGSAVIAASGWLGAIGFSGNTVKDTILHSGEGIISTIKWSLSGKYVVWINEYGIKIMRSNLRLDSADSNFAWKRIGHIDRPNDDFWGEMASVWKGKVEWIDMMSLESTRPDETIESENGRSPKVAKVSPLLSLRNLKIEKLLVGWGGTFWIIHIHSASKSSGAKSEFKNQSVGRPEIIKTLNLGCVISGLSLISSNLLVVLAYPHPEKMKKYLVNEISQEQLTQVSTESTNSKRRGGIQRQIKGLPPELCLIDLNTDEEIDSDTLTVSRYERLSASDYYLGVLLGASNTPIVPSLKGAFETLSGVGSGMWNATLNATSILNSSASVRSTDSKCSGSTKKSPTITQVRGQGVVHNQTAKPGIKIFIHSPYDCILATKRDLYDHYTWLLEHENYEEAWRLIEEQPEVLSPVEKHSETRLETPELAQVSSDEFYDDTSLTYSESKSIKSSIEKEKSRVGELWIQQLIKTDDWVAAGKVCGRVLKTAQQWENYVFKFHHANKFDDIADYIPSEKIWPPLRSEVYELILSYYFVQNRPKAKNLINRWSTDLYDVKTITNLLENQLKYRDVREDSIENGEIGRDWRIIMELLGKLYIADGHARDSLKCYIKLQDAETAMNLIREHHLIDVLCEDIPGLILLRVSKHQAETASLDELKTATSEAISLLVNEAHTGLIDSSVVVQQLQEKEMTLYLFFYLSALWRGDVIEEYQVDTREKLVQDGKALADQFSDLVVHLFANYDRELLMDFLKSSTSYTFDKATYECEERDYIPELVYLYSKTGQTKRALYLIIDRLYDVSQAISFAKEQNDSDLWEDLLNYSMDKPSFVRELLEEVGTTINPVTLIRRIPEGLEIEGLPEGLKRILKEHEIQYSISYGVAKVLRSEVAVTQNILRVGQQKGIKFDIVPRASNQIDGENSEIRSSINSASNKVLENANESYEHSKHPESGYCVGCREPFTSEEVEILVGFTCGHIWHVNHLLSYQNPDYPVTPLEVEINQDSEWMTTHSVGTKVTHARLLKDKFRSGCPFCNLKESSG